MYNVAVIVNMQVVLFEIKSHFVYNVAVIVNMQVALFEIKSHFVYNVAVIVNMQVAYIQEQSPHRLAWDKIHNIFLWSMQYTMKFEQV